MKRALLDDLHGLYAILDPSCCGPREPVEVAREILEGGCAVMQLRAKNLSDQALVELGSQLATMCRAAKVPFFINDRPDIALAVEADGVHLGQEDMELEDAKRIMGSKAIGISTHTTAQAKLATDQGADLIGYGPVFLTTTKKTSDSTVGIAGLKSVCSWAPLPVVAIGGITFDTLGEVIKTGVPLVAAIGAICGAESPRHAAQTMHRAVRSGR